MRATARAKRKSWEYAFRHFCRRPGTRINSIMTHIERGEDLKSIASMFGTDKSTIQVYQKALEGKLSRIAGTTAIDLRYKNKDMIVLERVPESPEDWPWPDHAMTDIFAFDRKAVTRCMKAHGMTQAELGRRYGLDDTFVSEVLDRHKLIGGFLYMVYKTTGADLIAEKAAWPYRKDNDGEGGSDGRG